MKSCSRLLSATVAALVAMTLVGCGRGHGDRADVYPAEGQVLWRKPLLLGHKPTPTVGFASAPTRRPTVRRRAGMP